MNTNASTISGTARVLLLVTVVLALSAILLFCAGCGSASGGTDDPGGSAVPLDPAIANATAMITEGRQTFRFETFGDEAFWGGALRLNEAISGTALGGVGPGLSPTAALALGLKVDSEALGPALLSAIQHGHADLSDPATTLQLLRLQAVLGLRGFFDVSGRLSSIGIQCALCHSTVNDSILPGIGRRRDGWANRDLDIGSIVALAPNLAPVANLLGTDETTVRAALHGWGPGKFDAALFLDGKAFQPDGASAATLIPPVFGLTGVNLHTWTGWESLTYWNAFVANVEMHGQGTFYDPRLDDRVKFPIAATADSGHITNAVDLVTPRLGALHFYQLALPVPTPAEGSFVAADANSGEALFRGTARCAECHVPPLYTEPGWNMHTAAEIGIDDFQSMRSPDERYRTAPLGGLTTHSRGGFNHDGRFATLPEVVQHYDEHFALALTPQQKADLVEFLKSL